MLPAMAKVKSMYGENAKSRQEVDGLWRELTRESGDDTAEINNARARACLDEAWHSEGWKLQAVKKARTSVDHSRFKSCSTMHSSDHTVASLDREPGTRHVHQFIQSNPRVRVQLLSFFLFRVPWSSLPKAKGGDKFS